MVAIIQHVKPCGDEMGIMCGGQNWPKRVLLAPYGPDISVNDQ